MAKRQKLTLQQKRRVAQKIQKNRISTQKQSNLEEDSLGALIPGIVISRFGEQADIADEQQQIFRVYLRQNLGSVVSGDRVNFRLDNNQAGVIESVEPRTSKLTRPTPHSGVKTVVANVEQIFVLISSVPDFSSLLLDRYLVACELANIETHIILNKTDLLSKEQLDYFEDQLSIYRSLSYKTFSVSSKVDCDLEPLRRQMSGKENIMVGQSGVGKSSLLNSLIPECKALTGEVSSNSNLGTHTTTASRLYFLPEKGHLIDSPGIREFGLFHIEPEEIVKGFKELQENQHNCKFRNCKHTIEKGCAILEAAKQQTIHPQRFNNFQTIQRQLGLGV